ncbi:MULTISPECIES: STAS domain-containing protein [Leptospira]|uniref:Anti-sigma factor antagonist n=2 Tax=Leptospira TaxID=171 RepID=A0AAW5VF23_9LEPT|nr:MULTISPECIES: STAS domain-containing protein [Leptospira]PKA26098.1 anti-sigma factor antagonist [Leptospira sp. mixed culture ATI2-C-A1]EKJ85052.1 STAS domain protein [Leptospira meyeri serovar Hardjo str. Went 5]EMJ87055.1 STAS domain protein [Leptospira meyeri serovar Semaranga str. Veldrot Semarang 173]MCW7489772.1 STAS domain-containing protein [Leptospira meyeri]MCW7492852.1 STAS domain-containing protein [Leptospira soteropolitanensis]
MELKLNATGKIKTIEIAGKFDIESTEEFESIFAKLIEPNPSIVSIEMSRLDYIDSSGIGSLIKSLNSLKNKKGKLILVGMKPMILNVFKLAKLDMFFEIMNEMDFRTKYISDDDTDSEIDDLLKRN